MEIFIAIILLFVAAAVALLCGRFIVRKGVKNLLLTILFALIFSFIVGFAFCIIDTFRYGSYEPIENYLELLTSQFGNLMIFIVCVPVFIGIRMLYHSGGRLTGKKTVGMIAGVGFVGFGGMLFFVLSVINIRSEESFAISMILIAVVAISFVLLLLYRLATPAGKLGLYSRKLYIKRNGKAARLMLKEADALYEKGEMESALNAYMKATADKSGTSDFMAGIICLQDGNAQRALNFFKSAKAKRHPFADGFIIKVMRENENLYYEGILKESIADGVKRRDPFAMYYGGLSLLSGNTAKDKKRGTALVKEFIALYPSFFALNNRRLKTASAAANVQQLFIEAQKVVYPDKATVSYPAPLPSFATASGESVRALGFFYLIGLLFTAIGCAVEDFNYAALEHGGIPIYGSGSRQTAFMSWFFTALIVAGILFAVYMIVRVSIWAVARQKRTAESRRIAAMEAARARSEAKETAQPDGALSAGAATTTAKASPSYLPPTPSVSYRSIGLVGRLNWLPFVIVGVSILIGLTLLLIVLQITLEGAWKDLRIVAKSGTLPLLPVSALFASVSVCLFMAAIQTLRGRVRLLKILLLILFALVGCFFLGITLVFYFKHAILQGVEAIATPDELIELKELMQLNVLSVGFGFMGLGIPLVAIVCIYRIVSARGMVGFYKRKYKGKNADAGSKEYLAAVDAYESGNFSVAYKYAVAAKEAGHVFAGGLMMRIMYNAPAEQKLFDGATFLAEMEEGILGRNPDALLCGANYLIDLSESTAEGDPDLLAKANAMLSELVAISPSFKKGRNKAFAKEIEKAGYKKTVADAALILSTLDQDRGISKASFVYMDFSYISGCNLAGLALAEMFALGQNTSFNIHVAKRLFNEVKEHFAPGERAFERVEKSIALGERIHVKLQATAKEAKEKSFYERWDFFTEATERAEELERQRQIEEAEKRKNDKYKLVTDTTMLGERKMVKNKNTGEMEEVVYEDYRSVRTKSGEEYEKKNHDSLV